MFRLECGDKLGFLSLAQRQKLSRFFDEPETRAMPHQLAALLGVQYHFALLIFTIMKDNNLCELKLLIYHTCEQAPIAALPYGRGFPDIPWSCPHCELEVKSLEELSFDIMAIVADAVEFV